MTPFVLEYKAVDMVLGCLDPEMNHFHSLSIAASKLIANCDFNDPLVGNQVISHSYAIVIPDGLLKEEHRATAVGSREQELLLAFRDP